MTAAGAEAPSADAPSASIGVPGYWMSDAAGGVFAFGAAPHHGALHALGANAGIVAMAALADGSGYWLSGSDGEVSAFGDAPSHGSLPALRVSAQVVAMAGLPDGSGYWLAGSDGGVFAFGAPFHGSLPAIQVVAQVVAMAAMPDGSGYWLAGSDGGVFAFGAAPFHGSLPGLGLSARVVAMAAMPDGSGYWLADSAGSVYAFGEAPFHGSLPGRGIVGEIAGISAPGPEGYLLFGRDGSVHPFGVAAFHGPMTRPPTRNPIVGCVLLSPPSPPLGAHASRLLRALQATLADEADSSHWRSSDRLREVGPISFPATDEPRVSIVIPVHGKADLTRRCLASVAADGSTIPYEVVVVDDDSPDDTAAMLEKVGNVRVVRNAVNLGFTRACNAGIARASGEYLVLLNNDTEVAPGWLEALVATADSDPCVGVVGAKLIYGNGRLQEAGGIIWSDGTGANYGRGDDPGKPAYNYVRDVDYCSGAALLVRRELLEKLGGGLDERYAPAYYEDTDLAFAARSLGYRVVYQPRATVVHHEGGSHGTDISTGIKRFQEVNRAVFAEKWCRELQGQRPPGSSTVLARDARRGPRAVIVDHMVPLYDQDSGSVRMLGLITILIDMGFVVTFVPHNWMALQPYTARLQQMGVEVLYGGLDLGTHLAAMGSELKLCTLSRPSVACQFISTIRTHAPSATVVYDTVDLHFLREQRHGELAGDEALVSGSTATKELELAMVRAADLTFTVSPEERQVLLAEVPGARVHVVPNVHEPHAAGFDRARRTRLLFVGGFLHDPNRDAVAHLVHDIMPLLRRMLPGVCLSIVGSNPTPDVLALAADDVDVAGWVEDLRPVYDEARVFVAPLRYGAGMKGKIGESLSFGVPTVTSSIGAEGMGLVHGRDILIADDPQSFASEVARLYSDEELWNELAARGRAMIAERYSPAKVKAELWEILVGAGVLPADGVDQSPRIVP